MMMSMDQWDWKTSAPEFVPGGISRGLPGPLSAGLPGNYPEVPHPGYTGAFSAPHAYGGPGPPLGGGLGPGGFPPPPPPPHIHHGTEEFHGPLAHSPGLPGSNLVMPEDPSPLNQLRAQYEWQIQSKDQKLRDLQNRLSREEVERIQMQADFERDRQGLMRHLNQLVAAVERYGIPVDGDEDGKPVTDAAHAAAGAYTKNRLDSKMEQLNSLLQGREEAPLRPTRGGSSASGGKAGYSAREEIAGDRPREVGRSALAMPGGSSASRHRVTFPHDVVQPMGARPLAEMEQAISALERRTGNTLDQQARQALEALGRDGTREALQRVETVLQGQGGRCTNLSSVLQSVCRKIRRRGTAEAATGLVPGSSAPSGLHLGGHGSEEVRRRRSFPSGSRPSAIDEEEEPGPDSQFDPQLDPRLDAHGKLDPRDDPRSAVGRKVVGAAARQPNPWSTTRFEKLSKQGAFELSRAGDGSWDLKICMNDLDPPLTDEGMQVYCRWLHQGLQRVREECSLRSLRQIRAEVHFSKNGLSDDAVGRLLQALQRSELSVTCLNLFANCIGPAGAHHICDFLRGAIFPLREVHLSHNKIDDEAALEMIHLLVEHPRYPPRRPREGGGGEVLVPVWLRLNNNWIRDPAKVLRKAESQPGVTVSHSHSRHAGGPTVCGWLHLYRFDIQDTPLLSPESARERVSGRRKDRVSALSSSAPRLEGSIAEGGPSPALNLHQPGRGDVLGRGTSAVVRLGGGAVGEQMASGPCASSSSHTAGDASVGVIGLPAATASAVHGLRAAHPESGVPPSEEHAPPGSPPPPPPVSDNAQGATVTISSPADAPTDVGTEEVALQEIPPSGRGAPEQTPEPDGHLVGSIEADEETESSPSPGKQEDDSDHETSRDPQPPVRLLVAPKILQRGAAAAVFAPESS